ncbi:hypothetical protein LC605_25730 [Nostoc sp. CHAB 5836]|uniref:hypothetical protein n=1 Tax=Nostoc sp. CHAB 5836 TaxID=2780404 RepID=UPI001E574AC2|nr:hypothetical protein [Nostoc sp. CHAB 5836]MCC5618424.1 hypothetical protein [Nostoc sp. CHAB 5836]
MSAALKSINGGKQQPLKPASEDKTIRPHCKISIEDVNWVRQQPPCVQQLWLDSVAAEQFGGAAHKLDTNLTYKSFQKAGTALTAQGLFQFEEVFGRLPSGRPGLIGYRVRNLHGYYNRFYWESSTSAETNSCDEKTVHAGEKISQPEVNQNHPKVEQIQPGLEQFQKNGQKSEDLQGFQKPNNVANHPLTTYQQPTKVVGMVVGSDALAEIEQVDQTAIAPLGGASPPDTQSASEREESPTATDCTTLTLVDGSENQYALSSNKNQDCGVKPKTPHEDTCSAPQVELVTSLDKWSDEAIAKRRELRPSRENKLRLASYSGDNPGLDFLCECWDDVALWNKIKQLIAQYSEWGVAYVDGKLVSIANC